MPAKKRAPQDTLRVVVSLRERRQIPEQADFRSFKQEWSRQVMSVIAPFEDLMHVPSGATYRMLASPHPFGGVILTFEDVTDKLALERKEYAPVALIEQVLATVGRSIAGSLEALPGSLHKRCPALTPEDLKIVQIEVSKACDLAVTASLANLDAAEEAAEPDATEQDAEAILFEDVGAAG